MDYGKTALTLTAVSDLHLAFDLPDDLYELPVPDEAEVVLMAGDVMDGCKRRYLDWVLESTTKTVIITLGNHELYGTRRDKAIRECRSAFKDTHVHFLLNESVVINGVRIAATDLWTDFQLDGTPDLALRYAETRMNDYRKIRVKVRDGYGERYRKLRAVDTLGWHREARYFIEKTLNDSVEPVVLMTHMGVSRKCIPAEYVGDLLSAAYTNDLEALFQQAKIPPVLCVYGHTHKHVCTRLDSGPVLYSNQRGYHGHEFVRDYDPERLIRITEEGWVSVTGYPGI